MPPMPYQSHPPPNVTSKRLYQMADVTTNLPDSNQFHDQIHAYASDNGYGGMSSSGLYCNRPFAKHTLGVGIDKARINSVANVYLKNLGNASATALYNSNCRQRIYDSQMSGRHGIVEMRHHEPKQFYVSAEVYQANSGRRNGTGSDHNRFRLRREHSNRGIRDGIRTRAEGG